jgi:hypothetical protein
MHWLILNSMFVERTGLEHFLQTDAIDIYICVHAVARIWGWQRGLLPPVIHIERGHPHQERVYN